MFVLDTNTLIYFFKGQGNVTAHLQAVPPKDVAVPSVVVYELQVGIAKSTSPEKRRTQLGLFLKAVTVLPFGLEEAAQAALIRADLERRGEPIGAYDLLIAGTAVAHQATLVTHNTAEFSRVAELRVIDWW